MGRVLCCSGTGALIIAADTTTGDGIYDMMANVKKLPSQWSGKIHDREHPLNQSRGRNMKQIRLTKILAASLLCAASLGVAFAQTTTTTTSTDPVTGTTTTQQTTTSAAGSIVTYTPDSDYFMFRTASGAAPVRYYYTKDTTVVDPAGRIVTLSAIRPDMPATVYYSTVGDRVVVRKVVLAAEPAPVIRHEETTTTTTTRP